MNLVLWLNFKLAFLSNRFFHLTLYMQYKKSNSTFDRITFSPLSKLSLISFIDHLDRESCLKWLQISSICADLQPINPKFWKMTIHCQPMSNQCKRINISNNRIFLLLKPNLVKKYKDQTDFSVNYFTFNLKFVLNWSSMNEQTNS